MNCYETIDLMGDALEGCLSPELRNGFDEHIEDCVVCSTSFAQLRVPLRTLERLPRQKISSQRRSELNAAFHRQHKRGE